jgi:tRNA threonylcarbamoyladenosine biosynthesis protein TsaE
MPIVRNLAASSPEETFRIGEDIGSGLNGGELILLTGGLGAGKTVFTKGLMSGLDFDPDDVTSPSFTLVNLYHARLETYHIDLWRLDESSDPAIAVGLDDILAGDGTVAIVEWAEKLGTRSFARRTIGITITGDGDEPRMIEINRSES